MRSDPVPGGMRLLAIPDAASYLGVSEGTLRNWLSGRRLAYVKIGRLTRISQKSLDAYIAAHTIQAVDE
jgi:excisionase family DNA binding protein